MKSLAYSLFTALILTGVGVYLWLRSNGQSTRFEPSNQNPPIQVVASPAIHYPVAGEPDQQRSVPSGEGVKEPPPIDESDPAMIKTLINIIGAEQFQTLFNSKDLVRRFVVTIDNATEHNQPTEVSSPLKPLERGFRVTGRGDERAISPWNYQRYLPYVNLVKLVNAHKLTSVYVKYYSLFQSAYQDLGTQGYFNDRLVEVIDNLLKSPEIKDPIKVTRPTAHASYKFVDDQLEALPSGQKRLIRLGNENAQIIKAKLRQFRALLIHLDH